MTRMLAAGVFSTMIALVIGPWFVRWLRRNEFGQEIRAEGPQGHIKTKAGTPTMGGLLIFAAMTVPFLIVGRHTGYGFIAWITTLLCAAIGFWDDWTKIMNRRSLGLSGKRKLVALAIVTAILGYLSHHFLHQSTTVQIPLSHIYCNLHWGYYGLLFLIIAGASNAVNLTDGIDGLASGTVVISLMAFIGISFIIWERDLSPPHIGRPGAIDLAIFAAALAGACVGFLWYNAHPAAVFMGDTGSMGLGGALAALAVLTKTELILVIIGGIFVVEALSVMLQVISFKRFGRRIFLMAPIHHHFELKSWSETQVMVRFWIVAGLLSAAGFTIWFRTV